MTVRTEPAWWGPEERAAWRAYLNSISSLGGSAAMLREPAGLAIVALATCAQLVAELRCTPDRSLDLMQTTLASMLSTPGTTN